jgi:hypothetical protein
MQTASLSKEKQLAIRQWTVSFIAPRQVPRWRASASLAGKLMLLHGSRPPPHPPQGYCISRIDQSHSSKGCRIWDCFSPVLGFGITPLLIATCLEREWARLCFAGTPGIRASECDRRTLRRGRRAHLPAAPGQPSFHCRFKRSRCHPFRAALFAGCVLFSTYYIAGTAGDLLVVVPPPEPVKKIKRAT